MVFVLGVLALIGLVGLALIAKTQGEFKRVSIQSASTSDQMMMDGIVRQIRETLRRDIWGDPPAPGLEASERPLTNDAPPPDPDDLNEVIASNNRLGSLENNEPFDAPGIHDRWLHSATPYYVGQAPVVIDPTSPPILEEDVLAWPHVSYLGTDISKPLAIRLVPAAEPQPVNPFMWAANSRDLTPTPVPGTTLVRYDASNLVDVDILQTPPPGFPSELIPGSTTSLSIRAARELWNSAGHLAQLGAELAANPTLAAGLVPQFPYFDTNADGEVDLYDADGDGCPDSPISFIVETESPDPNRPRQLYAVIRVVDHGSMLNVNAASSLKLPNGDLAFDETMPGLQRRGRSPTEFLFEDVVHRQDWYNTMRTANLVDYRSDNVVPNPDPVRHDFDVVRRILLGGLPDFSQRYNLYDLAEEVSLRHRNMLVRYDRRSDHEDPRFAEDYRTVDRALPGTMFWSRNFVSDTNTRALHYDLISGEDARWNRLNANYQAPGSITNYEGYQIGRTAGWRQLLDEDQTLAVKRQMLTTVNVDVVPPPDITAPNVPDATVALQPGETLLDFRLRQLWELGMNWPVLIPTGSQLLSDPNLPQDLPLVPSDLLGNCTTCSLVNDLTVSVDRLPPEWARVHPVDINMGSVNAVPETKTDFLRYIAAAMYLALDGVDRYQVVPLTNSPQIPNASFNRKYLAWQFAVNLLDYRDSDSVPTILEIPTLPGQYVFGLEKQPFFTEAYAHVTTGDPPPSGPSGTNSQPGDDEWFFAVELYVPPGWRIPTDNLYFRAPGADPDLGLIPLSAFGFLASFLDGGEIDVTAVTDLEHGNYYVFSSDLNDAPNDIQAKLNSLAAQGRAFAHPNFSLQTGGRGRIELVYQDPTSGIVHVLDMIDPIYSGGALAGNTVTGDGRWARRPSSANANVEIDFSLRRSTKGWRFTTGWQIYGQRQRPAGTNSGIGDYNESLGSFNDVLDDLDENIPESIWPALTSLTETDGEPRFGRPNASGGVDMVNGFESAQPFEAFDSVADLSRLYMLGPVNLALPPSYPFFDELQEQNRDLPVTALLAETLDRNTTGDLPGRKFERVAACRLDFEPSAAPMTPWSWRLFDYLTTQGHLADAVDNDGDGATDLADPTEAFDVLFRLAGRVNLNTAPATVLRSGPFMSFLPTTPAWVSDPFLGVVPENAVLDFNNLDAADAPFYWDFPTAIVAARENRPVSLRLPDNLGILREVARAERNPLGGGTSVSERGAFAQTIELAALRRNKIFDSSAGGRNHLFQTDRYWLENNLPLRYHKFRSDEPSLGPDLFDGNPIFGDFFSPDFRYRRDNQTSDYIPILAPDESVGDPREAAGIRGRDVYLSRWANIYATRSDCFTAYIALIDEDGNYVQRSQVTLDRSVCFREVAGGPEGMVLPRILARSDTSYMDDTK